MKIDFPEDLFYNSRGTSEFSVRMTETLAFLVEIKVEFTIINEDSTERRNDEEKRPYHLRINSCLLCHAQLQISSRRIAVKKIL